MCNVDIKEFVGLQSFLPETMRGEEFLARSLPYLDIVTHIDPEKLYPVRTATAHPVFEQKRIKRFKQLLVDGDLSAELGELMYASHRSYSACGLGSRHTDALVDRAQETNGAIGAKITGGGSGATVCFACVHEEAVERLRKFAQQNNRYFFVK